MVAKVAGPFDLIFQDADKPLYPAMLDRLVDLLRPGGMLVTDNVLWDGEVVPGFVKEPQRDIDDTRAIAEYNQRLNAHPSLLASTVPLCDGVAIAVKRAASEPAPQGLSLARRLLREADFNDDASGAARS